MTVYRAMIFDLDGTLVDTEGFHKRSWEIATAKMGLQMPPEGYEVAITGRPGREVGRELWGMSLEEAEQMVELLVYEYWQIVHGNVTPMPGLREFLDRHRDIPRAVATSGIRPSATRMLAELGLADDFPVVVTISDVTKGKPDPEIFLAAASAMNVPPESCLVFEDAPHGIQGALAAGMTAIGVTSTHPDLAGVIFSIGDFLDPRLNNLEFAST